jgi:osmotically-inducible protein OsmY
VSDPELQSQIQNALTKEPTLAGENVRVSVAEENIEVSGNVATAREKLTATRIVQSYAGNKKVVSHLTVGSHPGANSSSPTTNPEPNKGTPPAGATQPPRN